MNGMAAGMRDLRTAHCTLAIAVCLVVFLAVYIAKYQWVDWFIFTIRIAYSIMWVFVILESTVAMAKSLRNINREDGGRPEKP